MGIPIITTAANGVSEVITPGVHGEVIQEPSDLVSLASALSRWMHIWDQPVAFAAARVVCADFAAEFTLEKNLQETLVVMEELMAKKSIKPCGNVELG